MNVPENVVLEILLRLPVRSVIRFRCVCKTWCELINTSLFKDRHLALKKSSAVGDEVIVLQQILWDENHDKAFYMSFRNCCDYASVFETPSSNDFDVTGMLPTGNNFPVVINHVNGVLCIVGGDSGELRNNYSITLLNPSTRDLRELPPVPDLGFKWYTQAFGFGFDDSTNDYKVVGIVSVDEPGSYDKHIGLVYRLSTDSWKVLGEIPAFIFQDYFDYDHDKYIRPYMLNGYIGPRRCVFAHGSVHWMMVNEPRKILTFNMTTETFQTIQYPHAWKDYIIFDIMFQIFSYGPTISLVVYTDTISGCYDEDDDTSSIFLDVWVMKEYGVHESWTKLYSIRHIPELVSRVICFWNKDKIILETLPSKFICYDLLKGELLSKKRKKGELLSKKRKKGELYQQYYSRLRREIEGTCIESFVSVLPGGGRITS